jgi:hypothetical protein
MGAKHNAPHESHVWGYCVVLFYQQERNHQGLANGIPFPDQAGSSGNGPIRKSERLGGLLSFYQRAAA